MHKNNLNIIRKNISILKSQKRKCFLIDDSMIDFNAVQKTCREVDILLLPLYFAWEHLYKQKLSDVQFESHLKKPYAKFSQRPKTATWKILLLLFPNAAEDFPISTIRNLLSIYLSVVDMPNYVSTNA